MNFKCALVGLILSVNCSINAANAGIIYDFDVSDTSWEDPVYKVGDFNNTVFYFDFLNSTNFSALTNTDLIGFGVIRNGVIQAATIASIHRIDDLLSFNNNTLFLTVGNALDSAHIYGTYDDGGAQVGRFGNTNLYYERGLDYNVAHSYVVSTAYSGVLRTQVPEPSTLTIFALGIIGLASRRFKKRS